MTADLAGQVIDAVNAIFGSHPGHRALHAKGVLMRGSFTATPDGSRLCRAAHMRGEPVEATIRLSNASGDPGEPDFLRMGRGLAVKLYLPDGSKTDLVATNSPAFIARTPADFLALMHARAPDPETGQPDMERLGAYLGEHPEAQPAIQAALGTEPPASYACVRYNGLHAYRWIAPDGEARWVRWWWEPEAGEHTLPDDEAKALGPDYLSEELAARDETAFRLVAQIAADGDPLDDPTERWPEERETLVVGRLAVIEPETRREGEGDVLVFDPTRVTDGIELSDDPILGFRPRAYAASVERRAGVPSPF